MRNFFKAIVSLLLVAVMLLPMNIQALDKTCLSIDNASIGSKVTGLIGTYGITVKKDGSNLLIKASITCGSDVVKCGFKKIVVQRRGGSITTWTDYVTYNNEYADRNFHSFTETISIQTGYQYRALCTFYAKRSLFLTEKIDGTSNIV